MGIESGKKPHAVCIPFPAQGHVIPFMKLAKILHSRGFYITFVNTEYNHRRLIRSQGPEFANAFEDFLFETIPEGLPRSDRDATQDPASLCDSIRKNCLTPFRDLLSKLISSSVVPPISCIISDGLMSFAIKAAQEFGIRDVQFWTASACGYMGYLQYHELRRRGIVPFKDDSFMEDGTIDRVVDGIPGMRNIRFRDLPSFIRTTDPDEILLNYLGDEAQNCLSTSAMIFNTFTALEHEVLEAIKTRFPNILVTGPLSLMEKTIPENKLSSFRPSLWKEEFQCLEWLNKQEPSSVIYVNYGSVTSMADNHLKEFAWGLANSKHPFLWIVRSDIVMGDSAVLPDEFLEEIKDRGLLASWCPQDQVLSHPSIGVFLTHCGWNSTIESMASGVPLICWPFFAEQPTNCRYACAEWGIGVEVNQDVKREEIEGLIKDMMEGEKCNELKNKALEWKKKAAEATAIGGPSCKDLDRFLENILLNRK
ncbi:linamarin synthase 1-like [Lycium barbarum]|uniref:linamarin synthase 1-like n=1 Tax=Lycium barbarum TaxID=112863 RepID=UPI00293EC7F5|nr:linamarin synthase 1-like [Lycium barbarum]